MQLTEWIKPVLLGTGVGAIALAIIGFNWGGWETRGSAEAMSAKASKSAVIAALVPYCVQNSKTDPTAATVLAELKSVNSYQRQSVVEKAGWATAPEADKPNGFLAQACQIELMKGL
jgi:hypothetical protein